MKHQYTTLYIDGAWREPAGAESISVISPTTEEQIGVVPRATAVDVDAAVSAAARALGSPEWRGIGAEGRATILMRLADELEANATERASLTSAQNGMPIMIAGAAEGAAGLPSGLCGLTFRYPQWKRMTPGLLNGVVQSAM